MSGDSFEENMAVSEAFILKAVMRKFAERITELEEVLEALIIDCENKWGDPHTLKAAKDALPETGHE